MEKIAPLCICILFVTGCPETENENGGNDDATITNANVLDAFLEAWCPRIIACDSEIGPTFPTAADCVAFFHWMFAAEAEAEALSWQETSLYRVDNAKANECLAAIPSLDCDGDPGDIAACNDAIVGLLVEGDCCDERGGCRSDMHCVSPPGATGTCQTDAELGEPCENDRPCADGLYCDDGAGTPTCAAYLTAGDDCTTGTCGDGVYCDLIAAPPTCTAFLTVGDDCTTGWCAAGTYCDESAASPTCVVTAIGSPCFVGDGGCPDGSFCDHFSGSPFTCKSYVQLDGTCDSSAMYHPCAPGLTCLNDTCQALPSIGDPCNPIYDDCPDADFNEVACLDKTGTGSFLCTVAALPGEDCEGNNPDCAWTYGVECSPSTLVCVALPGSGDPCLGPCWPYGDLYCDASHTCAPRIAQGDPCSQSSPDDFGGCVLGLECDAFSDTCVDPIGPICH